jgi:c-di-GMP-binding flagellar brake protein YcgR
VAVATVEAIMPDKERRRYIRHLLVNPLEFQITGVGEAERTKTVDVSEGGLLFMSKTEVAPGTEIKLSMPLYDKVFKINARVVHSTKDLSSGLFSTGVMFVNYADAFKVKLIEQIYLIEEYRVLRSLQIGKDMTIQEASKEWINRYSERFQKLYW